MSLRRVLLAAIVAGCFSGVAFAQSPLAPLQSYRPIPNVGFFGGSLIMSQLTPFAATSGTQILSGNLLSAVYDPDGDPLTEGYDFYYQYFLDGASTTSVDQVNIFGFLNANVYDSGEIVGSNVGFGPFSSSTVQGITLSRTGGAGGSVRIEFSGPGMASDFQPGEASGIFAFRVSNGSFSPNGNSSITGINGVAANTVGIVYTPVSAGADAPEPTSVALLAVGAGVTFAGVRHRIRR